MIAFEEPAWLLLLPLVAVLGWQWPALGLWRPLRACGVGLAVLALAAPQWQRLTPGLDLWVLIDRSASAEEALSQREAEWLSLIRRSQGSEDRLFVVDFAAEPLLRPDDGVPTTFTADRNSSRVATALRYALAQRGEDRAQRLLLWTDGYSTEPLEDLAGLLAAARVPVDYRRVATAARGDLRVMALEAPERVLSGEPLVMQAQVRGDFDGRVPYRLERDGAVRVVGEVTVENGRGVIRVADRPETAGAHRYTLRLQPPAGIADLVGNNSAETWVTVGGTPRILLVTAVADDPVARLLRQQGLAVEVVTQPGSLHAGRLQGVQAVILNNVPAHALPAGWMADLDFFVRESGGGLLMGGGRQSYGSGGYFQTAVEELLPVSTELRKDIRSMALSMALVLDRSGSMSAPLPEDPSQSKMDLANEGAARAIELLNNQDAISVFAVDTEPHRILPLTRVGAQRGPLTQLVRRIASQGGGIYVGVGLAAAWEELKKAPAGQKHLILFADAADAEEPGNYPQFLAELRTANATVSVIGLGKASDPDAALLQEIAELGGGRIFFSEDGASLPALFAQETVAVARATYVTEEAPWVATAAWREISPSALPWPPTIAAYNLTYLRPEGQAVAMTGDANAAPLVAFTRRGLGRVAAVTYPLSGSEAPASWVAAGDLLSTLIRWVVAEELPPGLTLRRRVRGEVLHLELYHAGPTWEPLLETQAPAIRWAPLGQSAARTAPWQEVRPGFHRAEIPLSPAESVHGVVQVGPYSLGFGPMSTGVNPEWDTEEARWRELTTVAAVSGGVERTDLSRAWEGTPALRWLPLQTPFLIALVVVFLVEALATRLGAEGLRSLFQPFRSVIRTVGSFIFAAVPFWRRGTQVKPDAVNAATGGGDGNFGPLAPVVAGSSEQPPVSKKARARGVKLASTGKTASGTPATAMSSPDRLDALVDPAVSRGPSALRRAKTLPRNRR